MADQFVLKGRVFDGLETLENATVIVDSAKGTIWGFGERGSLDEPKDGKLIAGGSDDITILPGLIDAHVHFFGVTKGQGLMQWATVPDSLAVLRSVRDLRTLLHSGFTSVRELGTKSGAVLAQAASEGMFESPRIISCSRALAQTGGDDDPSSLPLNVAQELASYSYFCDGPWECRKAVRKVVRDGGGVVKIYASGGFAQGGKVRLQFTVDEIKSIVDEAHRSGLKVAAHAYGEEALANVIEGGVDSIEHGLGLTSAIAKMIASRKIFYVPTLVTYMIEKSYSSNPAREMMVKKHLTEDLLIAKEHNLPVVNGSDIVGDESRAHGRNYEEIVEEARFLGNSEALVAATSGAAQCLGIEKLGMVKEEYIADLIVVKGNPMDDIQKLAPENILHVMKGGKIYH
jgi:imidazolonepropionase-like amidohydrolase